jgi:hypothetical protein
VVRRAVEPHLGDALEGRRTKDEWRWILYSALATVTIVMAVALRDTKADRYVFPAYFFAAAGGTVLAIVRWPRASQWCVALDRLWPWGPAAFWFVLFLSRLVLR